MKKTFSIISIILLLFISNSGISHEIGEYFQGGIIFWNEKTDAFERGLIASSSDQARNIKWANREYATNATSDGLFVGKNNTNKIITALGHSGNYAAKVASFGDWYLPSKYELDLMFKQRFVIGEFSTSANSDNSGCTSYWSSTEVKTGRGWAQSFDTGIANGDKACGVDGSFGHVRAIRSYQEVYTTYECSIASGILFDKFSSQNCGKWNNYTSGDKLACGGFNMGKNTPVFECTVRNGSILVSSDGYLINPETHQPFKNIILTNETKYFYGEPENSPPDVGREVGIYANITLPK